MRRYLSRPALYVNAVVPKKLKSGVSGSLVYRLRVSYRGEQDAGALVPDDVVSFVLKRGAAHAGAILAGSAEREATFYRTFAPRLPVRTPRLLLTADDVVGQPTRPLVVGDSPSSTRSWEGSESECDAGWLLMEALPANNVWPQTAWTADHYRMALTALADLHAAWWDSPPDPSDYPWVWTPTGRHTQELVSESRDALLQIESMPWGGRFFSRERLHAWLNLLDDPQCLLDTLAGLPQTIIHGDYWPGNIAVHPDGPAVFDWQLVGAGPAAYDLACFHSSSRWWFGRLPLTLTEIRGLYLRRLAEHGLRVDRATFDMGMDAARAWRFAILWPTIIVEHHTHLLATLHRMRATAIEPAYASLRRTVSYFGV